MKTNNSVLISIASACILCVVTFIFYAVQNNNHDNGGKMALCLFLFFVFFFIGKMLSNVSDETEQHPIPEEGRLIRITWLSSCRNVPKGTPNPYIGMIGRVINLKPCGSFDLKCESCWLVGVDEYKFEYLD